MDMCKVFCCDPVVRNGNKETTEVLIRAMRDSNLPKFLKVDIELFLDIIKDLFPTTEQKPSINDTVVNKAKQIIE